MCGIAPANVDDCGRFGDPACPYFGVGEPEPEGLTTAELDALWLATWSDETQQYDVAAFARAVIAADRARTALSQPEPEIEPAAYLHRQGNYTEASEMSLSEDEKARGWTEEPLFRRTLAQPEPEGVGEGPTLGDIGDLCEKHSFSCDDGESTEILQEMITDAIARWGRPAIEPVPVAERLPELRGMFERILCVARSSGGPLVGNIQLADRLLDAFVGWAGDALPAPVRRCNREGRRH
jgi:hypothetical protein